MTQRKFWSVHHVAWIAAAGLVSACWLQAAVAAESKTIDPELAAHENWRATMARNPESAAGCFTASYPETVWVRVACKTAHPLYHPVRSKPALGGADVTGNGNDYVAQAAGLISSTLGTFPTVSDVTSEKGVGVPAFGDGGILGPNE
jgi:hypothetical protein